MYKYLLLVLMFGCAAPKRTPTVTKYNDVLPQRRGLIVYNTVTAREDVPAATANDRARNFIQAMGRVLALSEQKPIRQKTDLVYVGNLPARQVPGLDGDIATLPPVRFWLTIDNQANKSRLWVTNFEVADKSESWQPIEQHHPDPKSPPSWEKLWLEDIDASVTEFMALLNKELTKPRS